MNGYIIGVVGTLFVLLMYVEAKSINRDMAVCQLSHSYDTCHNLLYR